MSTSSKVTKLAQEIHVQLSGETRQAAVKAKSVYELFQDLKTGILKAGDASDKLWKIVDSAQKSLKGTVDAGHVSKEHKAVEGMKADIKKLRGAVETVLGRHDLLKRLDKVEEALK